MRRGRPTQRLPFIRLSIWRRNKRRIRAMRFTRDENGIAAVEFALILPLFLMFYLGLVEVSRGMRVSQKLDQIVRTLGDLAAQKIGGGQNPGQAAILEWEWRQLFSAGNALIAPLSFWQLGMTISEVKISPKAGGGYKAMVQWTETVRGLHRPCDVALTPSTILSPNNIEPAYLNGTNPPTYIIIADVTYTYSPGINFEMFKWRNAPTWTFRRTFYSPIRNTYDPPHIQHFGVQTT
ncbi:MAG: pilus assembly protein [Hyphomicrobiales bacterium]|nr:MAG: pilus assembly protein [Hyphomicrobiales bacterium]